MRLLLKRNSIEIVADDEVDESYIDDSLGFKKKTHKIILVKKHRDKSIGFSNEKVREVYLETGV